MTTTMGHDRQPTALAGLAAGWAAQQRQTTAEPQGFGGLDVDAIFAQWNAPPTASVPEQVERELHRKPQPALNANEIYKRWNAPSPAAIWPSRRRDVSRLGKRQVAVMLGQSYKSRVIAA